MLLELMLDDIRTNRAHNSRANSTQSTRACLVSSKGARAAAYQRRTKSLFAIRSTGRRAAGIPALRARRAVVGLAVGSAALVIVVVVLRRVR